MQTRTITKPKRKLTEAELEARRKGGRVRGEQLKLDTSHQSIAGKKGAATKTYQQQVEQGRKNLAKALEKHPDMRERAGETIARKWAIEKERRKLEIEKQALEEAERRRAAGEPEPAPPAPKKPRQRRKSKWERMYR